MSKNNILLEIEKDVFIKPADILSVQVECDNQDMEYLEITYTLYDRGEPIIRHCQAHSDYNKMLFKRVLNETV